jgi:hypothetical protein
VTTPELPVLYRSAVPLNRESHRGHTLKAPSKPLAFARGAHILPAIVDEFAQAARELPILFLPDGPGVTPVFVCGLAPGRNPLVTAEGWWSLSYLPAYLRRYPFLLGDVEGGGDPVMCIDERFEGFGSGPGMALFDAAGAPSDFLKDMMQFAAQYRASAERTGAFVQRLQALGLFTAVSLSVEPPGGPATTLTGYHIVDEARLKALPDVETLALTQSGLLPAIYAHLMSLEALKTLR